MSLNKNISTAIDLYIYLDESGALHHPNTKHFVIGGIVSANNNKLKMLFKRFEQINKTDKHSELKACECSFEIKKKLWDISEDKNILKTAIVIYKDQASFQKEDIAYNYLIGILIANILKKYNLWKLLEQDKNSESISFNLHLKCDDRSKKIESLKSLEDYLNTKLIDWQNDFLDKKKINVQQIYVEYRNSKLDYRIRFADFISNFIYYLHKFKKKNKKEFELFSNSNSLFLLYFPPQKKN